MHAANYIKVKDTLIENTVVLAGDWAGGPVFLEAMNGLRVSYQYLNLKIIKVTKKRWCYVPYTKQEPTSFCIARKG